VTQNSKSHGRATAPSVYRSKRTGPLTALVLDGGAGRSAVGVGLYRAIAALGIPIDWARGLTLGVRH